MVWARGDPVAAGVLRPSPRKGAWDAGQVWTPQGQASQAECLQRLRPYAHAGVIPACQPCLCFPSSPRKLTAGRGSPVPFSCTEIQGIGFKVKRITFSCCSKGKDWRPSWGAGAR